MPDNLPNQNNPNPWSSPPAPNPDPPAPSPVPPPSDPIIQAHSETAKHEQRDEHGRFFHESTQTTPTSPNPPNNSNFPLPVSFTQNNKYSERNDPPLVAVSVTNPVTYLKLFLKRFLKNEGIDIHLKIKPLTVIACVLALSTAFGTGFNVAQIFFPTSSPLLHRAITLQGNIQRSGTGQYYLSLPDNSVWTLRPKNNNINLANDINRQVMVKGNMTPENNVIEVKEILVFDRATPVFSNPVPIQPYPATNSAQPS